MLLSCLCCRNCCCFHKVNVIKKRGLPENTRLIEILQGLHQAQTAVLFSCSSLALHSWCHTMTTTAPRDLTNTGCSEGRKKEIQGQTWKEETQHTMLCKPKQILLVVEAGECFLLLGSALTGLPPSVGAACCSEPQRSCAEIGFLQRCQQMERQFDSDVDDLACQVEEANFTSR